MTYHNACDGTQEYRIRREIGREGAAALQEVPWKDAEADDGCDVSSTADVLSIDQEMPRRDTLTTYDETRHKGGQVTTRTD